MGKAKSNILNIKGNSAYTVYNLQGPICALSSKIGHINERSSRKQNIWTTGLFVRASYPIYSWTPTIAPPSMSLLSGSAFMEVFKLSGLFLFLQLSGGIDGEELDGGPVKGYLIFVIFYTF